MSLSIAMVMLKPKAKLSTIAIKADLAEKWADLPEVVTEPGDKPDQISFTIGDEWVIAAMMRAPIPWGDLEGPCETSLLWRDPTKDVKAHTGHLIVTAANNENPIERATLLTKVCSSILATCPQAIGVYWGDASLIIPSKLFQDITNELLPEGPAQLLWVDFRVGRDEEGRSNGFTQGMAALGHMDFVAEESPEKPADLRERLISLAGYVLENGPVINDGDTVGQDANERIKVVYADSVFGHEEQVMKLEYRSQKGGRRGGR